MPISGRRRVRPLHDHASGSQAASSRVMRGARPAMISRKYSNSDIPAATERRAMTARTPLLNRERVADVGRSGVSVRSLRVLGRVSEERVILVFTSERQSRSGSRGLAQAHD